MKERLFADFDPQTAEKWETKLIADLKGKPLEDLLWENAGLKGKPFYTKEDLPHTLPNLSNVHKNPEAFGNRYWANYQFILVENDLQANQVALEALENGADGLLFSVSDIPKFDKLLKDVKPEYCQVSFESKELSTKSIFDSYHSYLTSKEVELNQITGFINGEGVHFQSEMKNLKTCVLQSNITLSDTALQDALLLAYLIDLIDSQACKPINAFNCLAFETQLTNDYFEEISKRRSLRQCVIQLAHAYDIEEQETMLISTSQDWSKDIEDKHSYMLHATTQTMAAILGGTDMLVIKPFYSVFENNRVLAERMARNTSIILKEESYLAKNTDPAAGSYFLEAMTSQMTQKTIFYLKEIESKGGLSQIDIQSYVESKAVIQ